MLEKITDNLCNMSKTFSKKNKIKTLSAGIVAFLIVIILFIFPNFFTLDLSISLTKVEQLSKSEQVIYHDNCLENCPAGAANDNIIVDHEAIVLSSNKDTKFADWVAYKVVPANINGPERKRNWAKDPKIEAQFTFIPSDYKGMNEDPYIFDRGHQAPLAAFKSHNKWYVVNYLSNITPQKKNLNRGTWKKLESAERKLAKYYGEIYVLTGPLYVKKKEIKGPFNKRINYTIPSGYWKIISFKKDIVIEAVSFVFPQEAPLNANYCQYISKVSEIEKASGLEFFNSKMNLQEENLLAEVGCAQAF